MAAESNISDDRLASIDADSVLDRLAHLASELVIEMCDVGRNEGRRPKRLAARRHSIGFEAEQRENAVAHEVVRLTARFADSAGGRLDKAVNEENDVKWQARFRERGGSPHIHEHRNEIELLAHIDALPVAYKIGVDIRRQDRDDGDIALRPQLASQTN